MNTRECQLGCLELLFAGIYEIPNDALTSVKSIMPLIAVI